MIRKQAGKKATRQRLSPEFKATTNSHHALPVTENLLQQNFMIEKPNQVLGCRQNVYRHRRRLAVSGIVPTLHLRKVVGWSMSERMTATLMCDALRKSNPAPLELGLSQPEQFELAHVAELAPSETGARSDILRDSCLPNPRTIPR